MLGFALDESSRFELSSGRGCAVFPFVSADGVWLTAGFRTVNKTDVLDVRFHFSPEARGMPAETVDRWEDSAWMPAKLQTDDRRSGFRASDLAAARLAMAP